MHEFHNVKKTMETPNIVSNKCYPFLFLDLQSCLTETNLILCKKELFIVYIVQSVGNARLVYERAIEFFGDDNMDEKLYISFAKFEENQREVSVD